jgi:cobalt transporter subunit CbtA
MIFSRIVYSSILLGIVGGLLLTSLQIASLNPLIFAAESYQLVAAETVVDSGNDEHSGHSHEHDDEGWVPADGLERTAYTLFANIFASTGFAAMLLALMCLFWRTRKRTLSWRQGSLWGLAGFSALFLAPAIGLPPEIPGMIAVAVEHRQVWWALCAVSVAIGLGIFAFAPIRIKAPGLLFLVIPYIVGAPQVDGPLFRHPDPFAVQALVELHRQFVVFSAISSLIFWLVLGLACRLAFNRWFKNIPLVDDQTDA